LASSLFPRSRETKKPRVVDLLRHREELDSKFYYLADAPTEDPDGGEFLIRFSRKTKEHYLGSNTSEGKPTKWTAYYNKSSGKWNVSDVKKSASKVTTKATS